MRVGPSGLPRHSPLRKQRAAEWRELRKEKPKSAKACFAYLRGYYRECLRG